MPVGRPALAGLALMLASLVLIPTAPHASPRRPPLKPRLAVLVVFDQMRGDYLSRWEPLFEKGGFRRLLSEGAWFQDCHYPYAGTWTAAGHATMSTGCLPDTHGIIANEWYDRKAGKEVSCVETDRYTMVPPAADPKKNKGASPHFLLAPTLADVLKEATGGKARVVALSLKDRSAVLPGGRRPDACYWMDKNGRFVTSTYYRDREHAWVRDLNRSGLTSSWLGKNWQRSRDDVDYVRWAGPDDVPGEGKGYLQGRTFPHPFQKGKKGEMANYYNALNTSPVGNEVLLDLARRAIEAEKLGQHETTDFLSISFSSNDLIGHAWGPDSQEVLDVTLVSDRMMRDLMTLLDEKVGKDRWVLALTADHGICPLPEVTRAKGQLAYRVNPKPFREAAEDYLDDLYPPGKAAEKGKGQWIEKHTYHMLYLDRKRIARRGAKQEEVEAALAKWAVQQRAIGAAYTRRQLAGKDDTKDPLLRSARRSFVAERSGDVMLIPAPYCIMVDRELALAGTTHGSPHPYDTHVPLLVHGPGIRPGIRRDRVSPEQTAVILAEALGLKPPARAKVKVPAGLFDRTGH
jgi:predicted AlkP superfamily pyrophosphatase or phosphodiesterase